MSKKEKSSGQYAPRMLSYRDAAFYIGIAEKTLRNRCSRKAKHPLPFKPKRVAGKPVFDRLELDRYCDSLASEGVTG